MKKLQNCVYVLFSLKDDKFYIGRTTNLKIRLSDHFKGRVKSTATRRPLKLIYCEYHRSGSDSYRREKYFKTSPGKRTLKLMLRKSLQDISGSLPNGK